eukprot:1158433-Pelagomonas_calceolata.AAC.4
MPLWPASSQHNTTSSYTLACAHLAHHTDSSLVTQFLLCMSLLSNISAPGLDIGETVRQILHSHTLFNAGYECQSRVPSPAGVEPG